MIVELLMFALAFTAGLFVGNAFGRFRTADAIQKGIEAGRYSLTVSRSYKRRMARERGMLGKRRRR